MTHFDKSDLSAEKSSSSHLPPLSSATDKPIVKPGHTKQTGMHGQRDSVGKFNEPISSLSARAGIAGYDQPAQFPALILPTTNIQESSPIRETTPVEEVKAQQRAQAKVLFKNVAVVLDGLDPTVTKMIEELSLSETPESKRRISFMRAISKAIQELKNILQEIQLADAFSQENLSKEKYDKLQARIVRVNEMIEKQIEADANAKKGEKFNEVMKVLGPILSTLSTVISALLAVFTFGLALPLVVASIAIGVAFTTYSIVESATGAGITGKIVQAFNEFVKEAMPNSPEWVHTLVKVAVAAAAIVILALVAWAASGAVAANVAGKTATELAKTFAAEATKQLAVQLIPMTVLSSNALPEIVGNIMKANGANEQDQATAQIIMMIVQVLTVILAMVASGGRGGSLKAPKTDVLKDSLETAKATGKYFAEGGSSFGKVIGGLQQLRNAKNLGLTPQQIEEVTDQVRSAGVNLVGKVNTVIEGTNIGLQAADSVIQGLCKLVESESLKEVGTSKAEEEFIQGLIKMLEKILSGLQTNIDTRSEVIKKIQEALIKFFEELTDKTNQLFRVVRG